MCYLKFNKKDLINLEFSLNKEILAANNTGSYSSTTIIFSNTRKYHGLLVVPQKGLDGENHVLLHSLEEIVIKEGKEFNLGIKKYPNVYSPKGHKYLKEFSINKIPRLIYRIGGTVISKEIVFDKNKAKVLIKYTVEEANTPTTIKFKPFLAFRSVHKLSKANTYVLKKYTPVKNGINLRMYEGYPKMYMQFSKKVEFIPNPDWYYNIEYMKEKERGYDFHEDLYVPGCFTTILKEKESIIFSASLSEVLPQQLKSSFTNEIENKIYQDSFLNSLKHAANQFLIVDDDSYKLRAGFPWFGVWGRDTFISLPGLTLATHKEDICKRVLDTMLNESKNGLFPNIQDSEGNADYNSADAPLWFVWALQKYCYQINDFPAIWKDYGESLEKILITIYQGTDYNIRIDDNGLYYAGIKGKALTWMDAIVDGKGVTPRIGYAVELNLLWYNSICFFIELAKKSDQKIKLDKWEQLKTKIEINFIDTFWSESLGYLADFVNGDYKDFSVRPNMVFCASLPYSPLDKDKQNSVLKIIEKELLTPRGLRTLSPKHPDYQGVYCGSQKERDRAYHQGTVWPWLLGHFVEGYLKFHEESGIYKMQKLFDNFESEMFTHGLGTIAEIYDGNPPHNSKGAYSQAWSVAELLRIEVMLKDAKVKRSL